MILSCLTRLLAALYFCLNIVTKALRDAISECCQRGKRKSEAKLKAENGKVKTERLKWGKQNTGE